VQRGHETRLDQPYLGKAVLSERFFGYPGFDRGAIMLPNM
jgi:hypothetical protein